MNYGESNETWKIYKVIVLKSIIVLFRRQKLLIFDNNKKNLNLMYKCMQNKKRFKARNSLKIKKNIGVYRYVFCGLWMRISIKSKTYW